MITVIIAAKDADRWIKKSIQSLLNQTFTDWECNVSINGSFDNTESVIESINDKRIRIIKSKIPNKSLAVNRAIIDSKKDFICILDADDMWHSKKLEMQMKHFRMNSNVDILGTQMIYVDENDDPLRNHVAPLLPINHDECVAWLNDRNNPIANSSVMYKKYIHDIIGYYDPEKFAVEDYDMWMRAKRMNLKFFNLDQICLFHRIHVSSNFNSTNKQKIYKDLIDQINYFYSKF